MNHAVVEPPSAITDRVLRLRFVIVILLATGFGVLAGGRGDWNQFVDIGREMFSRSGLSVYVHNPDAQTGPISLSLAWLLSWTPRNGFVLAVVVCGALGVAVVWLVERMPHDRADRRARIVTLLGGVPLVFTWSKLGAYGHLDDALALTAAVIAVRDVLAGRRTRAAVLIGLALAVKPWAVVLLPLVLIERTDISERTDRAGRRIGPLQSRWALGGLALAIGLASWLPFIVRAPATLNSIRPTAAIATDSVLRLFGADAGLPPGWLRPLQLSVAIAVGALVLVRRRIGAFLLVVIAVRLATDPATWGYYTPGLVAGALIWDALVSSYSFPFATWVVTLLLAPSWMIPDPGARAAVRLATCLAALFLATRVSERVPSAGRTCPMSGPSGVG